MQAVGSSGNTSYDPAELRDQLGTAQVRWMQTICKGSNEALRGYHEEKGYIQKRVWYISDLRKACEELNQPGMLKFLEENNRWVLGYAPAKYFTKISDGGNFTKYRIMHFVAKQDVLPSEALKAAVAGLTIADCGVACQMARYGALLDVLGEPKFNRLFGNEAGQSINIGYRVDDELQPMRLFVDFTEEAKTGEAGERNHRPIKIGQLALINGVNNFPQKKPLGNWQSINVLCMDNTPGKQRFLYLGSSEEGETEEKMDQQLLEGYNCSEDPFYIVPEKLKETFKRFNPSIEEFKCDVVTEVEVEGYDPHSIQDFKVDLIRDLVALPLEQVSMNFVKMHPSNL